MHGGYGCHKANGSRHLWKAGVQSLWSQAAHHYPSDITGHTQLEQGRENRCEFVLFLLSPATSSKHRLYIMLEQEEGVCSWGGESYEVWHREGKGGMGYLSQLEGKGGFHSCHPSQRPLCSSTLLWWCCAKARCGRSWHRSGCSSTPSSPYHVREPTREVKLPLRDCSETRVRIGWGKRERKTKWKSTGRFGLDFPPFVLWLSQIQGVHKTNASNRLRQAG